MYKCANKIHQFSDCLYIGTTRYKPMLICSYKDNGISITPCMFVHVVNYSRVLRETMITVHLLKVYVPTLKRSVTDSSCSETKTRWQRYGK